MLEKKYNTDWVEAISSNIISFNGSGFSEYETLGTFFTHYFEDDIIFSNAPWIRYGKTILGSAQNLCQSRINTLSLMADHITFESWHSSKLSFLYRFALDISSRFRKLINEKFLENVSNPEIVLKQN